ncbi:hypothetical protein M8C21_013816, partial [Ambrosia artemisiifolia]
VVFGTNCARIVPNSTVKFFSYEEASNLLVNGVWFDQMRASMVCGSRDEKCWLDVKASAYSMKSDLQKKIIFDIKSKHEGDEDLNDIHKQKKSKYSMNRSAIALILGALQEPRSARQKHRVETNPQ